MTRDRYHELDEELDACETEQQVREIARRIMADEEADAYRSTLLSTAGMVLLRVKSTAK